MGEATKRNHTWISNAAASRLFGIKAVCLNCGQTKPGAERYCPGKRKEKRNG